MRAGSATRCSASLLTIRGARSTRSDLAASLLAQRAPGGAVETIQRAVRRADVLIQDLLLAAKAEAGVLPLVRREESLGAILKEVDLLHRTLAESKSLRFVVRLEGDAPRVTVDRHRIVQMLSNLTMNAIKFTPPGGRVELRGYRDTERLVLTVSDTGTGIPIDQVSHIFDRYWQASNSGDVGAGLGLSIARAIANAHGGEISVESAPGAGTTFTVVLPTLPFAHGEVLEREKAAEDGRRGRRRHRALEARAHVRALRLVIAGQQRIEVMDRRGRERDGPAHVGDGRCDRCVRVAREVTDVWIAAEEADEARRCPASLARVVEPLEREAVDVRRRALHDGAELRGRREPLVGIDDEDPRHRGRVEVLVARELVRGRIRRDHARSVRPRDVGAAVLRAMIDDDELLERAAHGREALVEQRGVIAHHDGDGDHASILPHGASC